MVMYDLVSTKTSFLLIGAEGGNRTHMTSRPLDFESSASTNFTTSAKV